MGTIPTPPTVVAGTPGASADFNRLSVSVAFWALTPRCYAYANAVQSLTSGSYDPIAFAAEVYDIANNYDGGGDSPAHDNSTDNTRIYIRTAGKYEITGQVQIANNATGRREASIRLNAGGVYANGTLLTNNIQSPVTGSSTSVSLTPIEAVLNAGDYLELFGFQNSGGGLNTVAGIGVTFLRLKLTGS